jgi:hypothetical protein
MLENKKSVFAAMHTPDQNQSVNADDEADLSEDAWLDDGGL